MTATMFNTGDGFEDEQNAGLRLSARQSDMLRTLNTLFDELCPAPIDGEEVLELRDCPVVVSSVSRIVRM